MATDNDFMNWFRPDFNDPYNAGYMIGMLRGRLSGFASMLKAVDLAVKKAQADLEAQEMDEDHKDAAEQHLGMLHDQLVVAIDALSELKAPGAISD